MKTSDLHVLDPLERITLPTSPTPGRMESLGRKTKRAWRGLCRVMEVPMDSWEERERRGGLTPAEAYRCWLFGEGLEIGVEKR
jgi:hypothetical protein